MFGFRTGMQSSPIVRGEFCSFAGEHKTKIIYDAYGKLILLLKISSFIFIVLAEFALL